MFILSLFVRLNALCRQVVLCSPPQSAPEDMGSFFPNSAYVRVERFGSCILSFFESCRLSSSQLSHLLSFVFVIPFALPLILPNEVAGLPLEHIDGSPSQPPSPRVWRNRSSDGSHNLCPQYPTLWRDFFSGLLLSRRLIEDPVPTAPVSLEFIYGHFFLDATFLALCF